MQQRNITELYGMQVFTDEGNYYGDIEEAVVAGNRINSWRIRATRGSHLGRVLGGARGATVPHQLVKSVGDVMIISRSAVPASEEEMTAA
jgi:sporulation protein YlmC with PRC-barrel domain